MPCSNSGEYDRRLNEVVVVAMDEASETRLGVGQDLTRWRGFHAGLIKTLRVPGCCVNYL